MAASNALNTLPGLRITRVESIPLRIPFKSLHKIASGPARPSVDVLLVRLHTDQGVSGIGETQAWRRHGSSETIASLHAAIHEHFAPQLEGKSPFDIASLMRALDETIYHSYYAQAAIADAMVDIQGKVLGVPAYTLLGGKCRERVPMCGLISIKPSREETLADAQRLLAEGYRTFVIKTDENVAAAAGAVKAVREGLGDAVEIRIDANAGMRFDSALELLKSIQPYRIQAAEQLLEIWDLDGTAELARRVDIPLLADEQVSSDHDLIAVIRKRAAAAFQTKVAKNGGLWYTRRLWQIADAAGMRVCPGNHPCTSVATASVAHLATSWPAPMLDGPFAFGLTSLVDDVVVDPIAVENAAVQAPQAPGLGLILDEKRIAKYRLDR
ncbi:MAG: mandelate racemase/muconate lactonizing enzyme family protein [Burkholderiales bacterium]|nr:mandelate racemase/muconate lactonizing enzyme family protein [Burkholderiales bacterium]